MLNGKKIMTAIPPHNAEMTLEMSCDHLGPEPGRGSLTAAAGEQTPSENEELAAGLAIQAGEGETLDELTGYRLRIFQPRHGYRFSVDPLLLADFAGVREGERVLDLGTGCGIIPLLLARRQPSVTITGVELQPEMAGLAKRNVLLNDLSGSIEIVTDDIHALKNHFPVSSFDLVVSNPPYRRPGTGKVSPRAGRDGARHESTATLADFLAAAKYLVKESGRICFIYHTCRLAELMAQAAAQKLAVLRLRMVHGSAKAPARMFLVELMKGRTGELQVEPPLMVRGEDGGYSEEKLRIYRGGARG